MQRCSGQCRAKRTLFCILIVSELGSVENSTQATHTDKIEYSVNPVVVLLLRKVRWFCINEQQNKCHTEAHNMYQQPTNALFFASSTMLHIKILTMCSMCVLAAFIFLSIFSLCSSFVCIWNRNMGHNQEKKLTILISLDSYNTANIVQRSAKNIGEMLHAIRAHKHTHTQLQRHRQLTFVCSSVSSLTHSRFSKSLCQQCAWIWFEAHQMQNRNVNFSNF